jgi:hypothetical protein
MNGRRSDNEEWRSTKQDDEVEQNNGKSPALKAARLLFLGIHYTRAHTQQQQQSKSMKRGNAFEHFLLFFLSFIFFPLFQKEVLNVARIKQISFEFALFYLYLYEKEMQSSFESVLSLRCCLRRCVKKR